MAASMAVAAAVTAVTAAEAEEKRIEDELSYPIMLSERARKAASEAALFKAECAEVGKQVDRLSALLRSSVRLSSTDGGHLYDRPLRRISSDVARTLGKTLALLHKCRRRGLLHRVVNIVSAADFRRVSSLLDASAADLRWALSILSGDGDAAAGGGAVLSLPPIASNDPILSWVWSFIATVQMGPILDRVEAASELASLAQDNDRNKKMIVEEGGIPPLLKLLKGRSSYSGQIAACSCLYNLCNDRDRVRSVIECHGVGLIVQVLTDSPMKVQIKVADLISRMAEFDGVVAREEFARENVIRPLVSLLSFETFDDDVFEIDHSHHRRANSQMNMNMHSLSSIVQISKPKHRLTASYASFSSMQSEGGGSGSIIRGNHTKKDRENESPEVKRELKISCSRALWMLAKENVSNSRTITETKGLLCLARLIEKETGELRKNCLMAIMEITSAAESNPEIRRSAFKTNSPAAKAVVEQLLRVMKNPSNDPTLKTLAIRSIGSLSRTFPARETRVICPLVDHLSNADPEVATEAAVALGKFASPENFLCHEHSRAIIEFDGVVPLLRLLRVSERAQVHGLMLLCYLAINGGDHEALEQARVLTALEGVDRGVLSQQPELREMIGKAVYQLSVYHPDVHRHHHTQR